MPAMRVFITGASSGIGQELARHYGTAGAQLGLVARRGELLEALAVELGQRGASVFVYAADVTDSAAMRRAIDDFVARAGGADLVIANAGIGIKDSLREGDSESVARLMSVNVVGVTNTIVPFIPVMLRQNSGKLVAMSSVAGHRGLPGRAAYSASKAAIITFMDALRMQLADTNVHAMTLCPGFIKTPLTAKLGRLPFLLDVDAAVRLMAHAIEREKKTYTLPWQMNLLRPVLSNGPEWLVRRFAPAPRQESSP
jgi:NAD(P)-dependent dehydrogenase (short-subunit alcohol dehydrogenase family)